MDRPLEFLQVYLFSEAALVYLSIGILFGVVIRLPLALISGNLDSESSDGTSALAKLIRYKKQWKWLNYQVPDAANPGLFPDPQFIHFLISRFPEKIWRPVSIVVNILPDSLIAIGVYFAIPIISSDFSPVGTTDLRFAGFLGMILFLSMPILLPVTARAIHTNGRTVGFLFSTLYFFCVALGIETGGIFWFAGAIIFGILAILSSLFAGQVIIFFGLPMACFYWNIVPLLIPVLIIGISFIFPPLGVKDILFFKWSHHKWYLKNIKDTTAEDRNLFLNIFKIFMLLPRKPFEAGKVFLLKAPLLILLYSVPAILLISYYLFRFGWDDYFWDNPYMKFCLVMNMSSLIFFLLTSTGKGVVLGEAERYFEYSAPMISILTICMGLFYIGHPFVNFFTLIIFQITVVLFIHSFGSKINIESLLTFRAAKTQQVDNLVNYLLDIQGEVRVATVPIKLAELLSSCTLKTSKGRIKYYRYMLMSGDDPGNGLKEFSEDTASLAVFRISPEKLNEKYGINYIVTSKRFMEDWGQGYDFIGEIKKRNPVYEDANYSVYKV